MFGKAIFVERYGPAAEVVRVGRRPLPEAGPGQVLVRMRARPINPSDLLAIEGAYAHRTRPSFVPGFEGVGDVIACGEGVEVCKVGDRVLPLFGEGTWQDWVLAPEYGCVRVPPMLDDNAACQLYINPLTAWLLLSEVLRLPNGATLAVNAGTSSCAQLITQFGRLRGLKVISIMRHHLHADRLRRLGAEEVIVSTSSDIGGQVRKLFGGKGVDAAVDAVGGDAGAELASIVRADGQFVYYGLLSGKPLSRQLHGLDGANILVRGFWLREWLRNCSPWRKHAALTLVVNEVARNSIALSVSRSFTLQQIRPAIAATKARGRFGKIVLV